MEKWDIVLTNSFAAPMLHWGLTWIKVSGPGIDSGATSWTNHGMLSNYIQLLSHWSSCNPSWQWRIIRNLIMFNFQQRLLDVHNCPKSKLLPVGSRNFHTLSSRLIRRRNLTRGVPNSALDFHATLLQQEMPRNAKRMPNHLTLRKQ